MLVETETVTLEEEMSYRGTPVLRYSIAYPQFRAEGFRQLFTAFGSPLLGVLAGAVLTAVIQSSSAPAAAALRP